MTRKTQRNDLGLGSMTENIVRNKYATCSIVSRMPSSTGTGQYFRESSWSRKLKETCIGSKQWRWITLLSIVGPRDSILKCPVKFRVEFEIFVEVQGCVKACVELALT
uniref:Uncharacterized protein n=2 Tax=Oryza TaxID=4527 RepID=Q69LY1_ORYSJ|nr:hypothetical protein [Oryza sativa Japonica Group]